MENQCNEILVNCRQQCPRGGYATIDGYPYCRLHFSFHMNNPKEFAKKTAVINEVDGSNFDSLMNFFGVVHKKETGIKPITKK